MSDGGGFTKSGGTSGQGHNRGQLGLWWKKSSSCYKSGKVGTTLKRTEVVQRVIQVKWGN